GKFSPLLQQPWDFGSLTDFLVSYDQLWVASEDHGLIAIQLNSRKATVYDVDQSPGFSSLKVLKEDKEGNIWIGHRLGATRAFGNFIEIFPASNASDNHILAITIDKNENLWYSTKSGLFCKNLHYPSTGLTEKPLQNTSFVATKIISLYTDSLGYIWAGTYGDGAIRIHPTTHQLNIYKKELSNENVLNISGKGNQVWMATLGGATKITYKGTQLLIEKITRKEGLVSDYIYQVFVDSKNRAWFASDRAGVDVLSPSGFTHFKKGLQTKVVFGLMEDKNQTIWANVQGEGLYKLDGDEFKPVNDSNLRDQTMGSICMDKFENLVLANDLGIDIFDINKETVRSLGEEVGLQDFRPNLNTWTKDNENRLYFGTDRGIIRYSGLRPSLSQFPTAHIESLYIFDTPIRITPQLSLDYDDNNITINYQALWYQQPENLTFKYQLTPHDRNWISTRNLSAVYSRLPPGEYTFKLRVSSSDNFDSSPETVLQFTIHPPFWQKTWFYMACLVAFITISYLFVHIRERHLLIEKTLLEAKVDERTKEIQSKNEEIKRQHEEISLQAEEIKGMNENLEQLVKERTRQLELKNKTLEEYAFINAHQLRAPVASILGLISLINKMRTPAEKEELIGHLHESAHKLDNIVRSITTTIEKGDDIN
ncbi:MAG: hypothetical protein K2Q22_01405, partial [Cytophagales bacterium]|nr:hypothetical protein [Cytophagales bacterium]